MQSVGPPTAPSQQGNLGQAELTASLPEAQPGPRLKELMAENKSLQDCLFKAHESMTKATRAMASDRIRLCDQIDEAQQDAANSRRQVRTPLSTSKCSH